MNNVVYIINGAIAAILILILASRPDVALEQLDRTLCILFAVGFMISSGFQLLSLDRQEK